MKGVSAERKGMLRDSEQIVGEKERWRTVYQ